ncbi:MAG: 16S rRNA (adenine(1518)-N(6)/adenine(1519)-N(6))-dimethyltransferase RsmA [Candidatus Sumerlaeaceae bacterium]|nr:16S rRNA (adenine(1518)-N(6)/adenine(1519)-N(6))-dimethyltransferase RsmA [Candidatus Sumerlaeaceae bacterium]
MERTIRRLLRRHGIELAKKFGQHLLVDLPMLERIAESARVGPEWDVVEVGAGVGNLTAFLLRTGAHVTALELDERFRPLHEEIFGCDPEASQRLKLCYGDALLFDFHAAAADATSRGRKFAIVGNIPYQITSPLIAKVILEEVAFDSMTLLIQREVAERLAAGKGGRHSGAISIKVHFHCDVRLLFPVGRRLFLPPPQVESQVIQFLRHTPPLPPAQRRRFFSFVEAAFGQRRKMISNAVAARGIGFAKEEIESALRALGLPPTARAEQLGLNEFLALYAKLNPTNAPK